MALYIGTNYHPHDWTEERWREDIRLMQEAGFTTVRLGHLCWDSYEPDEGVYTFEWFDQVMDLFAQAGIGVVLDIATRPAPKWVHELCPGCDIYDKSGRPSASLTRYMEDVDDPAFQYYALRFATVLVNRYKNHPALFAFGLCNELGAGKLSHSPYAQKRFQNWLKKKYKTIDALNKAWATQRWSRHFNEFGEVTLQENDLAVGPPEAWLDMRRFFSDGIGRFITKLKDTVEKEAPGVMHSSNHYAEHGTLGFDYLAYADAFVDYPGMGLYPRYEEGNSEDWKRVLQVYMQRLAETQKPMWCLESQTGSFGQMIGPYGVNRMHAFLCLLYRTQMILGWTWRSMIGGEEQYYYGMLGHDGYPTPNYYEYKQIASDFKKLSGYAFPYIPKPEIAVAYCYENAIVSAYQPIQYQQSYEETMMQALEYFDLANLDYNIVDLRDIKEKYKVLLIPGYIVMSEKAAENVRSFVANGGTAIMTGYSAMVDQTGKVFAEPHPGKLADVFGVRIAYFTRHHEEEQEIFGPSQRVKSFVEYKEHLEMGEADIFATFQDGECAISENKYGNGRAFYIATETRSEMIGMLMKELGISSPVLLPENIRYRKIAEGQHFYVNTSSKEIEINLIEDGYGVLSECEYEGKLKLAPFDAELIVKKDSCSKYKYI